MNLQIFAQEKTERATPRRRQKAREQGQVFSSKELTSALVLSTGLILFKAMGPRSYGSVSSFFRDVLGRLDASQDFFSVNELHGLFGYVLGFASKLLAPLLLGIIAVGLLSNYFQVGFIFSSQPLTPKLERINPISGFKRIFSKKGFVELVKSILKILLVGYVIYMYLSSQRDAFPLILDMDLITAATFTANLAYGLGIKAASTLLFIAIFDLLFQWYEYEMSLKMSKEDIKEEYKEVEGNPQTKSRIRQIQRQMSRGRMMEELKSADVVITNPTHLAVALVYNAISDDAPVVVAKGSGYLAQKIKEVAERETIPLVEDKSLAQSLFKSVEVGDSIPEDLYSAVAEILAFVYQLRERGVS